MYARSTAAISENIVFISHRLDELFALADRVTTLRDGAYVGTRAIATVEPGAFKVWVGPDSTTGLEGHFEVR